MLPDVKDILFLVAAISTRDMMRCNIDGKRAPCVVNPTGQISANDTSPYVTAGIALARVGAFGFRYRSTGTRIVNREKGKFTVTVIVSVDDGVVLAADSAGSMGSGQIYTHANKVANLCIGLPVGAMHGLGWNTVPDNYQNHTGTPAPPQESSV